MKANKSQPKHSFWQKILVSLLAMVMTVTMLFDTVAWAIPGNQTLITGNPKILYYEVPDKFVDERGNINVPRNVTFTLNANRDVVWDSKVSVGTAPAGAKEVEIDPITGIVHVPYDTYAQTITVTAISNDGSSAATSFFINITDEMATIDSVNFDWETAAAQTSDANGDSLIGVNGDGSEITIKGKVTDVNIPYTVSPSYVNDKNVRMVVTNNNNIEFEMGAVYSSYVYNYDNKLRLDGDPDGYVTLNTITNTTLNNPYGSFNPDSQADSKAVACVLNSSGVYTKEVNAFKPIVQNTPLHYYVTNNKTDEITDSADVTVNQYKTITLNANNELQLDVDLASDISWFDLDSKTVVDYAKTVETMTFYYWTGEIENKQSYKEVQMGTTLGNIGYENEMGTRPTIDKEYVAEHMTAANSDNVCDPFQRKLKITRNSISSISMKTPLAVPKVNDDVDPVKNVWICVQMQPMDAEGNVIGGRPVEVLYCFVLNLAIEEPASIAIGVQNFQAQGQAKVETQKLDGKDVTVYCLAGNINVGDTNGYDVYAAFASPILDKAQYVSMDYYQQSWQIRSAKTLDGLKSESFREMNTDRYGRHMVEYGNELGFYEVKLELTATTIGKKYELGKEMLSVSYYFEILPNVDYMTLSNELTLSDKKVVNDTYSVADTEEDVIHAMIGQTLKPDCLVNPFYQTYEYTYGGVNPTASKVTIYGTEAEAYIKRGLIKFHSMNEEVATVDSSGVITAHKPGVAYVLVYAEPGIYAEADPKFMEELGFDMSKYVCSGRGTIEQSGSSMFRYDDAQYIKVVVNEDMIQCEDISINSVEARTNNPLVSILEGTTLQVEGKTKFTLGISTLPVDAATPEVTWSTSDTSIARVNAKTGEVSTYKAGNVTITATLNSDSSIKATQEIVVKAVPLQQILGIMVDNSAEGAADVSGMTNSGTIDYGKSFSLMVSTNPDNATDDGGITWVSSDPDVATVDDTGKVTSIKAGTTIIKAYITSDPAVFAEYTLTVVGEPEPTGKKGDVDGNGTIQLKDAQLALRAALHLTQLTDDEKLRADVDGTTGVTLKDAQMILRAALHLTTLE